MSTEACAICDVDLEPAVPGYVVCPACRTVTMEPGD